MKSMKNVVIYLMSFFLATMIGASSCQKKAEPKRDFECKVDGNYFTYGGGPNDIQCYTQGDTSLNIMGSLNNESVAIWRTDLNGIKLGNYLLNSSGNPAGGVYRNQPYISNIYYTDSSRFGFLSITELDPTNKIVAGTFYFKAYCQKYDSAVNITEGRFRLNYLQY